MVTYGAGSAQEPLAPWSAEFEFWTTTIMRIHQRVQSLISEFGAAEDAVDKALGGAEPSTKKPRPYQGWGNFIEYARYFRGAARQAASVNIPRRPEPAGWVAIDTNALHDCTRRSSVLPLIDRNVQKLLYLKTKYAGVLEEVRLAAETANDATRRLSTLADRIFEIAVTLATLNLAETIGIGPHTWQDSVECRNAASEYADALNSKAAELGATARYLDLTIDSMEQLKSVDCANDDNPPVGSDGDGFDCHLSYTYSYMEKGQSILRQSLKTLTGTGSTVRQQRVSLISFFQQCPDNFRSTDYASPQAWSAYEKAKRQACSLNERALRDSAMRCEQQKRPHTPTRVHAPSGGSGDAGTDGRLRCGDRCQAQQHACAEPVYAAYATSCEREIQDERTANADCKTLAECEQYSKVEAAWSHCVDTALHERNKALRQCETAYYWCVGTCP